MLYLRSRRPTFRFSTCSAGHASSKRLAVVTAAAVPGGKQPSSQKQQPTSSSSGRNARLYELFEDDGWGVETVSPAPAAPPAQQKQAKQQQKTQPSSKPKQQSSQPQGEFLRLVSTCVVCHMSAAVAHIHTQSMLPTPSVQLPLCCFHRQQ
jgi:hypothetical protein